MSIAKTSGTDLGHRLRALRSRCGLTLRQLAAQAGVTSGMISPIERDKTSPSLITLQKILSGLGTDLASFFRPEPSDEPGPVFSRDGMPLVTDGERNYTIVLPRRDDIGVEILDEQILPSSRRPPFERLRCDVAGYVLAGELILSVRPGRRRRLRPGDAFYVSKSTEHRGYAADGPARLITVCSPARYQGPDRTGFHTASHERGPQLHWRPPGCLR